MTIKKPLFALLFIGIIIGSNISSAAEPFPTGKINYNRPKAAVETITGTWLYLWWHGSASITKADGAAVTKPMFIPESYRETADQKSESFLRFRADGTGTFFRRFIVFKYNGEKITVVTKDRSGQWVKGDRPELITDFRWEIQGNQIIIRTSDDSSGFNKNGKYNFVFNTTPTRKASRYITARLRLNDELIIYRLGQFLRVGPKSEQDLLRQYGIE